MNYIFLFVITWDPNAAQLKDGMKSKIIVPLTTILAANPESAHLIASGYIPQENRDNIEQVKIHLVCLAKY